MSNAGARIHKAAKSQYAAIPNAIAQSRALSPAARAVLVELLSRPDDWEAKPSQLAYKPHLSVRTVYRILGELIEAGYVVRSAVKGEDGKFKYWRYDVFDTPIDNEARAKFDKVVSGTVDAVSKRKSEVMRAKTRFVDDGTHTKTEKEESTNRDGDGLTDQQKAIRALAQFHEAACGQMVAGWARKDMDALAEDFSLARIEEAIAQAEGRRIEKPFAYLRRVLLNIKALPPATPAKPAGFWGRDFTDGE